jgi:hypothetical protein
VRTVGKSFARNPPVDTGVVLTREARNAVVGIIATGLDAETAVNGLVTCIGRISTVLVLRADPATDDDAARKVFANGWNTVLTDGAGVVGVAQGVRIRAVWTARTSLAPGPTTIRPATVDTAIRNATIQASVRRDAPVGPRVIDRTAAQAAAAIRINIGDGSRVIGNRGGSLVAAARRGRSDKHQLSK